MNNQHPPSGLARDEYRFGSVGARAQHVLVDGLRIKWLPYAQTALVEGDCKSYSIAAASVLAKVTRDRLMRDLDKQYPGYGFADHKGYATPQPLRPSMPGPLPNSSSQLLAIPAQSKLNWNILSRFSSTTPFSTDALNASSAPP